MCNVCEAHNSAFASVPGKDYGEHDNKAERIMVIEIDNLRDEVRALEQTGQTARSIQIRVAGHADVLPTGEGDVKRESGADPVAGEPCYIEQIRYLIYQLKGARVHLDASVNHLDTVV